MASLAYRAAMRSAADVLAPRYARPLFALNALIAVTGVLISLTLNITGYYVGDIDPTKPTILGNVVGGQDTVVERFFDWITYFTILSNIVVAVVMSVMVFAPQRFVQSGGRGLVWRALRLDTVVMITVTGVVYNILLADGPKTGWDAVSNSLLHIITPIVTVLVWLLAGPRGLINLKVIGASLVLPTLWAVFALTRGAIIGAYPYPFLDVATNGYASVIGFIGQIVVIAVVLALILLAIDGLMRRVFFAQVALEEDAA